MIELDGIGTHWWCEILDGKDVPLGLEESINQMVKEFNDTYTRFDNASLLSRLNDEKRLQNPPSEFVAMMCFARDMYEASDGAFDISVGGPLHALGYGTRRRGADVAMRFWERAEIRDDLLTIPSGATIDLGGFGKGWLIDKLGTTFRTHGIEQFIINGGGDIFVASDTPITFALEDPADTNRALGSVMIARGALAASSIHKRTWTLDGARQHHIIDPKTNAPHEGNISASFVTAPTALIADTLATIVIIRPDLRPKLEREFRAQIMTL